MKQLLKRLINTTPKKIDEMMKEYESLPLPKGSPEEIAQRALITWQEGERQKALELYNEAIVLNPNDAVLYLNRGNLKIELELIDAAIADLEEAVSREPDLAPNNLDLLKVMKENPILLESFLKKQKQRLKI